MQQPPSVAQPGRAHRHRFESPFWRKVMFAGLRTIPESVQLATMPLWAGIFYSLVPSARRAVEANLRQVMGPSPATVAHARSFRLFVNYAQSIANMYTAYLGEGLRVEARTDGREKILRFKDAGRGVILATGHLGYWSMGAFLLDEAGVGAPVMAMAEEPNAATQELEERLRKRFTIVYTTGSPFASLELVSRLGRGESVAMQIDRHTGAAIELDFFGRKAWFPLGPATLGRTTGAPIIPVFMVREGLRGFVARVEDPIIVARTRDRAADLRDATERLVRVYASYVRRYPEQWFNFHDFWAPPRVHPVAGAATQAG